MEIRDRGFLFKVCPGNVLCAKCKESEFKDSLRKKNIYDLIYLGGRQNTECKIRWSVFFHHYRKMGGKKEAEELRKFFFGVLIDLGIFSYQNAGNYEIKPIKGSPKEFFESCRVLKNSVPVYFSREEDASTYASCLSYPFPIRPKWEIVRHQDDASDDSGFVI